MVEMLTEYVKEDCTADFIFNIWGELISCFGEDELLHSEKKDVAQEIIEIGYFKTFIIVWNTPVDQGF